MNNMYIGGLSSINKQDLIAYISEYNDIVEEIEMYGIRTELHLDKAYLFVNKYLAGSNKYDREGCASCRTEVWSHYKKAMECAKELV